MELLIPILIGLIFVNLIFFLYFKVIFSLRIYNLGKVKTFGFYLGIIIIILSIIAMRFGYMKNMNLEIVALFIVYLSTCVTGIYQLIVFNKKYNKKVEQFEKSFKYIKRD
jgi:hypothetical protein